MKGKHSKSYKHKREDVDTGPAHGASEDQLKSKMTNAYAGAHAQTPRRDGEA